ncbi:MAG: hypothetical protein K2X35_20950 [Bryobacteraceae bacterium]|nr:hypothetical protein [Bryobacteraceae bacterium]
MRPILALAFLTGAYAQQSTVTYNRDLNGRQVVAGESVTARNDGASEKTVRLQSINGRRVPFESVEERVLRDDASGKSIERIVRRYDQTGNPLPPEKVLVEEEKSGNTSVIRTTTFRGDVNGRLNPAERTVTESRTSGSTTNAEVIVERPNLNGGFAVAEKRTIVTEDRGDRGKLANTYIYRPGGGGGLVEALRETREEIKQGDQVRVNSATYEPDIQGRLNLRSQAVETVAKNADGTESVERTLYRVEAPGVAGSATSGPRLVEQQLVDRRAAGAEVVETLSVRRPSLSDPSRLGTPEKISETVCQGKCLPDPKPAPKQN